MEELKPIELFNEFQKWLSVHPKANINDQIPPLDVFTAGYELATRPVVEGEKALGNRTNRGNA